MERTQTVCALDLDAPRNGNKRRTLCNVWTRNPKDWTGETTCPLCLRVQARLDQLDKEISEHD